MPAGTWQCIPFLFQFLVLCLCPGIASSQSFGCGLPGEGEFFLSPAHAVPLAHEATEPEHSKVGTEVGAWGHLSISQRPASYHPSPLCHPPTNSHCTQINEHAAAAWEPPLLQPAPESHPGGWLLAACPCAWRMAELQAASHSRKVFPAKLRSRDLASLTLSQRLL